MSGVEAGRAGSFGLVLGVDRGTGRDALLRSGADVVVDDLQEVVAALGSVRASSTPDPARTGTTDTTSTDTAEAQP